MAIPAFAARVVASTMSGKEQHITERLKEVWLNEKNSPEILQYEGELVSTLLAQIETQVRSFQFHTSHQPL